MKNKSKKSKAENKKLNNSNSEFYIIPRYFCLFFLALGMYYSSFVYKILFSFTVYPVNFILNIFYSSILDGNFLIVSNNFIEIIPACIAVSAYVFLFILNLTTPMNIKTRIKSLILSTLTLLAINIFRIIILSILLVEGYPSFDMIHKFTWYFLSTLFVVAIWFSSVKLFKIKNIPVYTDTKELLSQIKK